MSSTSIDIKPLNQAFEALSTPVTYNVAAGATTINSGEPVARALGAVSVTALATSKPVVG